MFIIEIQFSCTVFLITDQWFYLRFLPVLHHRVPSSCYCCHHWQVTCLWQRALWGREVQHALNKHLEILLLKGQSCHKYSLLCTTSSLSLSTGYLPVSLSDVSVKLHFLLPQPAAPWKLPLLAKLHTSKERICTFILYRSSISKFHIHIQFSYCSSWTLDKKIVLPRWSFFFSNTHQTASPASTYFQDINISSEEVALMVIPQL